MEPPIKLQRGGIAVALLGSVSTVLWGLALLVLPNSAGHAVMGRSWPLVKPLILPAMLATIGAAAGIAALVLLRTPKVYGPTFRIRVGGALLMLCLGAACAVDGALPAAYAVAGCTVRRRYGGARTWRWRQTWRRHTAQSR